MADAVTSQTIHDGERKAVLKFTNASDGTGEDAVKKVDVSALAANSAGLSCNRVTINKIWWQCTGMSVKIEFDATANVLAIGVSEDSNGYHDYSNFSGIPIMQDLALRAILILLPLVILAETLTWLFWN